MASKDSPIVSAGKALAKTGKGPLKDRIDPAAVPEGGFLKGLPPAAPSVDPETDRVIRRRSVHAEIPDALEEQIVTEYVSGVTEGSLESKYSLSHGYVQHALKRRYGSLEAAKAAIKGLVSEIAIACGEHTLANVEKLHPSQSGMLTSVMVNSMIALEKHERETPRQLDFGSLARVAESLERMEKHCGMAKIVDVGGEVTHLDSDARKEVSEKLGEE